MHIAAAILPLAALVIDCASTSLCEPDIAQAYALCIRDFRFSIPVTADSWKEEEFHSLPECKEIEIYFFGFPFNRDSDRAFIEKVFDTLPKEKEFK